MATDTRRRLVEAATKRFKREGFRNVGVEQIFGDVGISRTAFYKHFASKDDLMVEALAVQSRGRRTRSGGWSASARRSAVGQLRALFDVVESIVESDDFHGCLFIHAAIEFPLPHDPAHQAATRNRAPVCEMIHDIAERAGAADPPVMAEELCMLMEGVYVARQLTGRRDVTAVARRIAEDVIRRHLGATTEDDPAPAGLPTVSGPA